jgi:hypothetical protein
VSWRALSARVIGRDITYPVTTLRSLFNYSPIPLSAPLFSRSFGPFDWKWVLRKLQCALLLAGINPVGFNGHFIRRRGGAKFSTKGWHFKGRIHVERSWKSDSIDRYFSHSSSNKVLHQFNATPRHSCATKLCARFSARPHNNCIQFAACTRFGATQSLTF